MRLTIRSLGLSLLAIMLEGCGGGLSTPVGLDVALRGVEADLKNAAGMSLQDLVSPDAAQEAELKKAVIQAQCFYRKANPLVPVMTKDFTLTLQGTFTNSGKFMVSGLSTPAAGVELGTVKALQQTIALPVTFASLSSLPDVFLQQKAIYVKDIDDTRKAPHLDEALKDRETMKAKIKELIAGYSENSCK
jgi:hypothetical protein